MAHLEAGPYVHERTDRILGSVEPSFTLTLQRSGSSRIDQGERMVELGSGDFTITESTRPYRREYDGDNSVLVMLFPQRSLTIPARSLGQLVGTALSGDSGLGAVASRLLGGIADNLSALNDPLGLSLINSALDVVTTLLADRAASGAGAAGSAWELMAVRNFIMERLGEQDLTPGRIAADSFISERRLHHLFQNSGSTVAAWIRERRLEMAHRDLSDPGCGDRTVREIGERWGFRNPTHFARAFRARYGSSPSRVREALGTGPPDSLRG